MSDPLDEALARVNPAWPPLTEQAKHAIRANADAAPEMTEADRRRLARLLGAAGFFHSLGDEDPS